MVPLLRNEAERNTRVSVVCIAGKILQDLFLEYPYNPTSSFFTLESNPHETFPYYLTWSFRVDLTASKSKETDLYFCH